MAVKQILVVEDESIVAEHIRRNLQIMGYSVTAIASCGEKAIKEVEKKCPDLVLMDIMLNGEMDGIETAKQIRSSFNIPIIYLTAYSDENMLERAKITEPFGYIIKPFNERELHTNIEMALYKHKIETKLKESENRLKESNQWLFELIKSIGDAVIATDPEGIIKLMNPIAEALTGWKQEDALENPLTTVFNIVCEETGKHVENPVTKVMREGIFYGLADDTHLIAKEGTKIPVDIIGSTIKDDRDNIIGIVLVFYDIIERKRFDVQFRDCAYREARG
jgi:PAS domain S-box-containing protein